MAGRIGIFGGTFDPVHSGHMAMADCVFKQAGLEKLIFLPNGNPPHKPYGEYAEGTHRFNMLSLAVKDKEGYEVSDYELDGQRHYTFDTLEYFKGIYPQHEVVFIIGADSLDYLHKWYRGEELIRNNSFVVVNRNFRNDYDFEKNIMHIRDMGAKLFVCDMPCVDVSSTQIRQAVAEGVSDLPLDTEVYEYIKFNNLYCNVTKQCF